MAKPAQIFQFEVIDGSKTAAQIDALIVIIKAVLAAYDAAISITDVSAGGYRYGFYFTMDYVDEQSSYGNTVLSLIKAFLCTGLTYKTTVTDTLV